MKPLHRAGDGSLPQGFGWWGKLPARGDFVGRGLPRALLRTWDDWLMRALAEAERRLGADGVRERLRGMPPWQWLLPPQAAAQPVWCGIVAASSDRVGRAFPLVVAEAWDEATIERCGLEALQARALALGDWLYEAARGPLKDFEAGAARWASRPLGAAPQAATALGDLRRALPAAASLWWCTEPVGPVLAARGEAWPPHEALMLALLGAA